MGEVDIPQRWYEDNGYSTAEVWSLVAFANRPDLDKELWLARLGETGTAASVNPCTRHAPRYSLALSCTGGLPAGEPAISKPSSGPTSMELRSSLCQIYSRHTSLFGNRGLMFGHHESTCLSKDRA